ncbi:MAG: hypothetical protein ACPGID_03425 [Rubricella sp.]
MPIGLRLWGGLAGLALVALLIALRWDTAGLAMVEVAAFATLFFGWWVFTAIRDIRRR